MLYMSFVSFILPAEVSIEEKLNSSPPFSWHQSVVLLMSSCRVFISMLWISMQMLWIVMQMLRIPYKNCGLPHKLLRIQSGRWRGYVLLLQTPKYGCVLHHFPIYMYISTLQCDMTILVMMKQLHGAVMVDWLMDEPYTYAHSVTKAVWWWSYVLPLVLAFDFFYSHLGVP